jgi:hypothetical protein
LPSYDEEKELTAESDIAEAIGNVTTELLPVYGSTHGINSDGNKDWATMVFNKLESSKHNVEVYGTGDLGSADTERLFLRIDGRFYDAESPEGVSDYMNLPIFKGFAERQSVWREYGNRPAAGNCFEDAFHFIRDQKEGRLVHGWVVGGHPKRRIFHAWVELPSGFVYEPQSASFIKTDEFYEIAQAEKQREYDIENTFIQVLRSGHSGPWDEAEKPRARLNLRRTRKHRMAVCGGHLRQRG